MTIIGPSVSISLANDTKPRMLVTVFEVFALSPFNGSAISTDHALSLNLKKEKKILFESSEKFRFIIMIDKSIFQILYTCPFFGNFNFAALDFCCLFVF